ncbi:MAG: PH domain-containing protein [Nanoarchaeota archaeon]
MDVKMLLGNNERIKSSFGSVYLTSQRVIYLKKGIITAFKDIMLKDIESIEFSKKRFFWILLLGFSFFSSGLIFSLYVEKIFYAGATGVLFALSFLIYFFIVEQQLVIHASGTSLRLEKVDLSFLRSLREECFRQEKK